MPIYDYQCPGCGKTKKDVIAETDAESPQCLCGVIMDRVINKPPHIKFIGEGWYETEWGSQRHNVLGGDRSDLWDDCDEADAGNDW